MASQVSTGKVPGPVRSGPLGWFANRRIGTKIVTTAGVGIVLSVLIGGLALVRIGDLRDYRQHEVGRAVPYLIGLENAGLAAKAASTDERGYLMAGDAKFKSEFLGRQPVADAALRQARSSAGTPAEVAKVDEVQTKIDSWFDAVKAEFAQFDSGNRAAAVKAAYGPNRDLRKAYETVLTTEIDRASKALVAAKGFDATVRSAQLDVLVLIGVGLVIALAVAVYVGRLVVVPLRQVARVLRAVADGDLTQTAVVRQRDEVGEMADALGAATESLRGTVQALSEAAGSLAASSEELSTTSQNVNQAVEMAGTAVDVAASTNAVVARLGDSSVEIGNVIKVITAIAEQTNLLALNATMEADEPQCPRGRQRRRPGRRERVRAGDRGATGRWRRQ